MLVQDEVVLQVLYKLRRLPPPQISLLLPAQGMLH